MNFRQDIMLDKPLKLGDRQMQSLSVSGVNKKLQNNLMLGNRQMQHLIVYFENTKVKLFRINNFFSAKSEVQMHYCGQMNIISQFCSSRIFLTEQPSDGKFNTLCCKRSVQLLKPFDAIGNHLS